MTATTDVLKVLEKIFLSPRIAVAMFLACLTVLLFGSHLAAYALLIQQYRAWLWFLLLLSGFYSVTFPAQWLWNTGKASVEERDANRWLIGRLHLLTVKERHILQEHFEDNRRVVSWSVNRLEIASLAHDGIIDLIQQHGSIGYFKVREKPWVYLLERKELIDTPDQPRPPRSKYEWMI